MMLKMTEMRMRTKPAWLSLAAPTIVAACPAAELAFRIERSTVLTSTLSGC